MNIYNLGDKMPEWDLEPIFNETVPTLSSLTGRPTLILFFYMGCPGCKGRAIPFANRLVFEETPINVIGIHTRFEGRMYSDKELQAAKEEFYIRFPYYRDKTPSKTFSRYQAGGTPHWMILDKDGGLAMSMFGSDPNNALYRLDLKIKEMLQTEEE